MGNLNYVHNQDVEVFLREASAFPVIAFDTETDMQQNNHLVLMQFMLPDGQVFLYEWSFAP